MTLITPNDVVAEIEKINVTARLYNAPVEVGFLSEEIIKVAGHFMPRWKNHDGASLYMKCLWTRDGDVEFETFETIDAMRRRALGIIQAKTYYYEGKGDSHN